MKWNVVILLALLCGAKPARTQIPLLSFRNYTRDNGFPVKLVRGTTQDKYGFIWFAAEHNLIRYDGSTYRIYRHETGDSLSIPESTNYNLRCCAGGMLLLIYDRGICRYDYDADRFTKLIFNVSYRMVREGGPIIKGNGIWFATTDHRLHCYDLVKGTTKTFAAAGSYISAMLIDSRDNFWIGTHDGLYTFDPGSNKYGLNWRNSTDSTYGASMVTSIVEDESGGVWFNGYNSGIYRRDPGGRSTDFFDFRPYNWRSSHFYTLSDLTLWTFAGRKFLLAASHDGLVFLDRSTRHISLVRHDATDQSSILSDEVSRLFIDNTGEIWLTTPKGVSEAERLFTNFRTIPLEGLGKAGSIQAVWAEPRNGTIWIAADSIGLLQYDWRNSRALRRIPVQSQRGSPLSVNRLYGDKAGRLWLGTNEGVGVFDTASGKIRWFARTWPQHDTTRRDIFASSQVSANFIEDGQGNIWVGTVDGISIYSSNLTFLKNLAEEKDNPGGLVGKEVFALYPNNDHQVWVATKTVNLYDLNTGRFVPLGKAFLPRFAERITDDGRGNLYFTNQSAVYQYRRSTDSFYFPAFNSLIEPTIGTTIPDSRGRLWVFAHGTGLVRVDPGDSRLRRYTRRNGLLTNELADIWSSKPGAPVFLVADQGLQYFYPDSVQIDTTAAPLRITGINILETALRAGYHRFTDSALSVSYRQNVIRFEFGLLDYSFTEDVTYRYRLEGFDKDWIDASNSRSATYTNLDHGDYVFRVRARNHDGYDNGPEARVMLHIVPPFWKTWWFITMSILVAGGMLYKWVSTLQKKLRAQLILHRFTTSLYGSNSIEDIFRNVARDCVSELGSLYCCIYTTDEHENILKPIAFCQSDTVRPALSGDPPVIPIDKGLAASVAKTGLPETRPPEIVVPVRVDDKVFGVIDTVWAARRCRTRWHLRILQAIAEILCSKLTMQVMQDRIRDKIARDLHDDMGSTLSSINILSKMALENAGGTQHVNSHLTRIRDNSANMLETMSDIVWAINSANDTMERLIFRMKEFATDMLDPLNIRHDLKLEGDFRTVRLDLEIRRDFYLVFKEAVNNAAKYSGCSHIGILLSHRDSLIEMQVADDGKGFDPQQIRSGNGLANMQERARRMGGQVSIASEKDRGASIRLTIRSHD